MKGNTYFVDTTGNKLGSDIGILSITLFKGMEFSIHDNDSIYNVKSWKYHHGHPDENAGLTIILE